MKLTMTPEGSKWVRIKGVPLDTLETIKSGVRPASNRSVDPSTGECLVHWQWIGWVATLIRRNGWAVDWSSLPTSWQMIAAGISTSARTSENVDNQNSPYAALYLLSSAPMFIVKAVYKALVSKHHPDVGGDVKKFQEIDIAYRSIQKNHTHD